MVSSVVCWRCLRASQRTSAKIQVNQNSLQLSPSSFGTRLLSNSATRWQEQETIQEVPRSKHKPRQPASSGKPIESQVQAETLSSSSPKSNLPPNLSPSSNYEPSVSEMQRQISQSLSSRRSDLTTQLARRLRRTARSATETYITYGLTEAYYKSCSTQAGYTIPESQRMNVLTGKGPPKTQISGVGATATNGKEKVEDQGEDLGIPENPSAGTRWWFDTLGLQPTFSTWSQVTFLHMYVLTVRLRGGIESATTLQNYHRYLLEHFSNGAEDKMAILHSMIARGIRNRYLKDLFLQWRGLLAAYDEGLVQGDAVLAGAVWRNMWKGRQDVDWEKVALVVAYIRKSISLLGELEVEEIVSNLEGPQSVWIRSQQDLQTLVQKSSDGIAEPVTE